MKKINFIWIIICAFLSLVGCAGNLGNQIVISTEYLEVGQYKGVIIETITPEVVTEEDIQIQIMAQLKKKADSDVIPELTEDNVKTLFGYDTVEEYRIQVRTSLEKTAQNAALNTQNNLAWDQALANTKVKIYPQELLESNLQYVNGAFQSIADIYGMEFADALEYANMTETDLEAIAKEYVKSDLLIEAIAEKENIKLSNQELELEAKSQMAAFGYDTVEELEAYYGGAQKMYEELRNNKVFQFVSDNAVVR